MKRTRTRARLDHRNLPRPGGRTARTATAVLDAAFRLLITKGLQNLSVADVAAASGIHATTIYRRWKSVNAIALDASLRGISIAVPIPDRGSLQADLTALVRNIIKLFETPAGKALLDICRISEPEVAAARAAFFAGRFAAADILFNRAIDRGEWNDALSRKHMLEMLVAPIYLRALVTQEPLESLPVAKIVRVLLRGFNASQGSDR